MYDIHMHVVPGVDDGSWDLQMSRWMLDVAGLQGVERVLATPHSSAFDGGDHENTKEQFEKLKEMAPIPVYLGCEVLCEQERMATITERLEKGIYPTMNGTQYVLTEFFPWVKEEEALICARWLLNKGWIPIIAHVERYRELFKNDSVEKLKAKGCCFQINVYSIFDEVSEEIKLNAHKLMNYGWVDFLGSDAHRLNHRPPSVGKGLEYMRSHWAPEYLRQISTENAAVLLNMQ